MHEWSHSDMAKSAFCSYSGAVYMIYESFSSAGKPRSSVCAIVPKTLCNGVDSDRDSVFGLSFSVVMKMKAVGTSKSRYP